MQIKHILVCLVILFIGQIQEEETMTWNESRKLTWSDFRGEVNPNSDAVALTASGITFGFSVSTSGSRIVDYSTTVEAHFYPNKSWYNQERADEYILGHEQLHFDITELYTRKFRERLSMLKVNPNIRKQLKQLHTSINKQLNDTQKLYDEQSVHSINVDAQKQWEEHIKMELGKLDQFKS